MNQVRALQIALVVVIIAAAVFGGYANYRLNKLNTSVVNYKYGLASAQNQEQAMAVAQRFDYETSSLSAKQASAGLGGFFKAIVGKGWLWGKGSSGNVDNSDLGPPEMDPNYQEPMYQPVGGSVPCYSEMPCDY
jgi:hypothetical protein